MTTSLGKRLKKALVDREMMQKELAERAGTTEITISRYIRNDRIPQISIFINICKTLHVSADYLLGLKENDDEV